ncbi:MAG TPA: HlyD family efflux transporter periplasmic adaptor subunit, partial [Tepidisphaeraceae bacterium]|nr:HlyD family efflux transporter periplasmic adaptor subunit [Tepidisphaeraceae bacterium]
MKRIIVLILVVGIVAAVYFYTSIAPRETVLTGMVTTDDVIVSPQIQGRLKSLNVKQGDVVKAGDELAEIEPAQWAADMSYFTSGEQQAANQVAQAEADLKFQETQTQSQIAQAEATFAAAQADVVQGEADLENARITYEREDALYKQSAETAQAHDQAKAAFDGSKAHVDALRKQARAAEAAVAMARANVEQIAVRRAALEAMTHQHAAAGAQKDKAQIQLGYTKLVAPIDGIVDVRAALKGEVVNPGQAVVTLINPDDLWVRADVEESYIDRIRIGDTMTVRLPSGATREGTVFFRGIDADYATQRDVSRTKRDIKTFEV